MTRVWLITGSSRGLVQALADAVLASGHKLVALARNTAPLAQLVERYGDQVRIVPLDVTDAHAADNAIKATIDTFGRLDVLVLDLNEIAATARPASGISAEASQNPCNSENPRVASLDFCLTRIARRHSTESPAGNLPTNA